MADLSISGPITTIITALLNYAAARRESMSPEHAAALDELLIKFLTRWSKLLDKIAD